MRKNVLTIIALISLFALVLTGCGSKEETAPTTEAAASATATVAPALGLSNWSLTTTTWSSPNGATVNLTATPAGYAEGYSASFIVRLEGEDVANLPCTWDGTNYTAAAELNAADGYCYYVLTTDAEGNTLEVPVNTPAQPTDEALINMASALESYCNVMVNASAFEDGKLVISSGTVEVQAPKITNAGETITVSEAVLALSFNGEEVDKQKLTLAETGVVGGYELELENVSFKVPEMENDQQLNLALNVTLSNGQVLNCAGGNFFYNDGELLTAVG